MFQAFIAIIFTHMAEAVGYPYADSFGVPNSDQLDTMVKAMRKVPATVSLFMCAVNDLPAPSKNADRLRHLADWTLRKLYRLAVAERDGTLAEVEGRTGRPTDADRQVALDDMVRNLIAGEADVIVWDNNGKGFHSGLPMARLHVKASSKRLGANIHLAMRRGTPQGTKGASNTYLPFAYVARSQEDIDAYLDA